MAESPNTNLEAMEGESQDSNVPNRSARRLFVYISMAVAWATAVAEAHFGGDGKVAHLVADSGCTYVITMGVTYIAGHSVDRANFLGKMFNKE